MHIYRLELSRGDVLRLVAGSLVLLSAALLVGFLIGVAVIRSTEPRSVYPTDPEVSGQIDSGRSETAGRRSAPHDGAPGHMEASDEMGHETRSDELLPQFALQAGAFILAENAEALTIRLKALGYEPITRSVSNPGGRTLIAVDLSYHETEAEARSAAQSFTEREGLPVAVVPVTRRTAEGRSSARELRP
jgi:hypothetical protein